MFQKNIRLPQASQANSSISVVPSEENFHLPGLLGLIGGEVGGSDLAMLGGEASCQKNWGVHHGFTIKYGGFMGYS